MLLLPLVASAQDIEVQNADGVTIYYNYINDGTELEVTYCPYKYQGNVAIPEEVTYMNRTRKVTSIGNYAFDEVDIPTVISLIENPFEITGKTSDSRTFTQNTFFNATLYVPKGTIDKYKATDGWKDFAYIVESDPTGIKNIETKQLEEVSYYGLDGKRIESPKSGSVVIKKAGQKAMKVVVK